MIILRTRIFFYRDPNPELYKFSMSDYTDDEGNKYEINIEIEESGNYKSQLQRSLPPVKEDIKKIRRGIKLGFLYSDRPGSSEDTHSLGRDSSKYDKDGNLESVVWSKKINTVDRFNYRIYRPKFDEKRKLYITKVLLESCDGHELNGRKTYQKQKDFSRIIKLLGLRLKRKCRSLFLICV